MSTATQTAQTAETTMTTQEQAQAQPRIIGEGKTLATRTPFYLVTSMSEPGRVHVVMRFTGRLQCDCVAGRFGKVCAHRRVVHDFLVAEVRATMPGTKILEQRPPGPPDARETAVLRRSQEPFHILK